MPQTTPTGPEACADDLVAHLLAGNVDPAATLDCLERSSRPYFTWAAAWAALSGVVDRDPGHDRARAALAVLQTLEPAASRLDGRRLARPDQVG